ncbi:MAG: glycosyltransferase family 2 protein [Flavobacterium sp.]|nr:glycosyltransferase family 2 protein [Flavobacterium sp.]MBP8157764.1 glycosyltransferase family 2 protein [Flavobacterium sp.]
MSKPLVSIIIPTFNRANLIAETLNSVKMQTYSHWECIIVDDGSTDTSEEVIAEFCNNDNRFHYYKRPENLKKGANTCRNFGLQHSQGEYINWFDSDDVMYAGFIEKKLNAFMQNPATDVVSSGFVKYNSKEGITSREYNTDLKATPLMEYANNKLALNTPTFLYKRTVLNHISFDENLTRAQDLDFTFRIISKPNLNVVYINEVLFKVLIHNESITGSFTNKKSLPNLKSELQVRKQIVFFYINSQNTLTKYIFDNYLKTIKKILEYKKLSFFYNELRQIPKVNGWFKIKLFLISVLFFATGKGMVYFSNQIKKVKV